MTLVFLLKQLQADAVRVRAERPKYRAHRARNHKRRGEIDDTPELSVLMNSSDVAPEYWPGGCNRSPTHMADET